VAIFKVWSATQNCESVFHSKLFDQNEVMYEMLELKKSAVFNECEELNCVACECDR